MENFLIFYELVEILNFSHTWKQKFTDHHILSLHKQALQFTFFISSSTEKSSHSVLLHSHCFLFLVEILSALLIHLFDKPQIKKVNPPMSYFE